MIKEEDFCILKRFSPSYKGKIITVSFSVQLELEYAKGCCGGSETNFKLTIPITICQAHDINVPVHNQPLILHESDHVHERVVFGIDPDSPEIREKKMEYSAKGIQQGYIARDFLIEEQQDDDAPE